MNRVQDVMSHDVVRCYMDDSLNRAAQIMWENDCGCVPVVDDEARVIGIITDRDICMAGYTQGKAFSEIPVASVCSTKVVTCSPNEALSSAEDKMTRSQIRRLPVTTPDGVLVGLLSLSDLANHMKFMAIGKSSSLGPRNLSTVLEAVSRPRDNSDSHREPRVPQAVSL